MSAKKKSDKRQRSFLDPIDDYDFDFKAEAQELFDDRGNLIMCMGRISCTKCGQVYGICSDVEVQLTEKGNNNMLPNAGSSNQGTQQQSGGRQRTGFPYLKESDLSQNKAEFRIIQVKQNESTQQGKFSDIIVKISLNGNVYLWGLRFNNPNYSLLISAFGNNENDWTEKKGYLFLEPEEFTGKNFIRCELITKKK